MTQVFDATPLIYLGKADRLDEVADIDRRLVVPERVCREVVAEGLERGYADAKRVDTLIQDGTFERRAFEENERFGRLVRNTRLSEADTSVLLLADELGGTAVMDEGYGRSIAETEGVETRGTAYVVLSRVKDGDLAPDDAREIVDAMLDAGWHCSTDLYAKLLRKLDSLADE